MMSIADTNKLKKPASQKNAWAVFYVDINNFGHFFGWAGWCFQFWLGFASIRAHGMEYLSKYVSYYYIINWKYGEK